MPAHIGFFCGVRLSSSYIPSFQEQQDNIGSAKKSPMNGLAASMIDNITKGRYVPNIAWSELSFFELQKDSKIITAGFRNPPAVTTRSVCRPLSPRRVC